MDVGSVCLLLLVVSKTNEGTKGPEPCHASHRVFALRLPLRVSVCAGEDKCQVLCLCGVKLGAEDCSCVLCNSMFSSI